MQGQSKTKDRFYMAILVGYAFALGLLFWNQYRPNVILARCSDIAMKSSQAYQRNELVLDDTTIKGYEELLHECLNDFGY
ncbi:hypothetical protein IPM62_04120 [Candidatus Woesebacteria bacterium]|nr:MAG: hypothetical protein IPM62_04120 [Candidatus Woesebacteria bacterium]